jgi:hypothetical protein
MPVNVGNMATASDDMALAEPWRGNRVACGEQNAGGIAEWR